MKDIVIRPIERSDFNEILEFTNTWIGEGYFEPSELEDIYKASLVSDICTSFIALDGAKVAAIRLTYAPGTWSSLIKRGLSAELWNIPFKDLGYFKSLFVAKEYQAQGLGRKLSELSLEQLKKLGAKGVLCHSWLESPHNSSVRYLEKFGSIEVKRHEKFWYPIDYECTRCRPERCQCTAVEMLKVLESRG